MKTINVTEETFKTEVSQSTQPVLLDFWAPWCGPCRMLGPVLEEIATENEGRFKVAKVNIDENPLLASAFGVHSVPTIAFVNHGELRDLVVGLASKSALVKKLEELETVPA
jgi:thioredoxin 1